MSEASLNEISKHNYNTKLVELIELIKICDYVAIDCTVETTGFLLQNETLNPAYMSDVHDWAGSWYDVIKLKERSHYIVEVGVAVFKRVPEEPMELEAEVFNIPVLPACIDDNEIARFRGRTSARVQFDGYGQQFIKNVDFDINSIFYKPAPYLNRQLQEEANAYMLENPGFMVCTRKRRLDAYFMPELYEEVTEVERKSIIDRLKGVSKVFEAITQNKKPVVGHHLLLKLIFIYKDFIEYLPDTYPEFFDKISELFNVFYDTKQIAHDLFKSITAATSPEKNKALDCSSLYELIRSINSLEDVASGGFHLYVGIRSDEYVKDITDLIAGVKVEEDTASFCYTAGFDALACGALFLDLISIMNLYKLNCGFKSASKNPDCFLQDYLDLFLNGDAYIYKNKIYQAPELPNQQNLLFLERLQAKKNEWQRKIENEKEKQAKARKSITTMYNLVNTSLKKALF